MEWYIAVLKKYAVFNGRAQRKEYWIFFLVNIIIYIVLGILQVIAYSSASLAVSIGVLGNLYILAVFIPNLAVGVRRLHDIDKSGWWLLITLIPLIGIIVLIYFLAKDGQAGPNRFGPNPKEPQASSPVESQGV